MEDILNKLIDNYGEDIIKTTQKLVKIDSTWQEEEPGHPFGQGVAAAFNQVLELAKKMGLKGRSVDGYAIEVALGEGSQEESVAVLSHMDVMPAGGGWRYQPFGGQIENGRLYGRGASDDKGPLVAVLFAMKALKESGLPLNRRVISIMGGDEEKGSKCLQYYLAKEGLPWGGFSPDGDFPVIFAEKGILHFAADLRYLMLSPGEEDADIEIISLYGGDRVNMVPAQAEAVLKVTQEARQQIQTVLERFPQKQHIKIQANELRVYIQATGKSHHGSMPQGGINAISLILAFLAELSFSPFGLCDWLHNIYQLFGKDYLGKGAQIATEDEVSGSLTLNLGKIKAGWGKAYACCDIRYPVTKNFAELWQKLDETAVGAGLFPLRVLEHKTPLYVPKDSPLITQLLQAYQETVGDNTSKPLAIGGGTYSRFLKNCVAFGPVMPGAHHVAHEANEYIETKELIQLAKIYAQAIYKLAR